jgi:hypothetical protein
MATEKFMDNFSNPYNLSDLFMHLTNYAINKDNGEKFVKNDDPFADEGSKRSY